MRPASSSLVIFTRVEGLLCERTHAAIAAAGESLRVLASHDVPLVLVSAWDAADIRTVQRTFALTQPFICQDGAALHVPRAWLTEPAAASAQSDEDAAWEVFRFSPPSVGAAFTMVSAMYLARGCDPLLTVGIGCDPADYALLAAVDVPIVVRNRSGRAPEWLHQLPGVYVTSATGTGGWSEAVLGACH
jgi:predicted mannosyl-3-phosphoglycerate phosphatase (HAD superfamily)